MLALICFSMKVSVSLHQSKGKRIDYSALLCHLLIWVGAKWVFCFFLVSEIA